VDNLDYASRDASYEAIRGLSQKSLQSARLLHRRRWFLVQVSAAKLMQTTSPMLGIGDPAPDFALMEPSVDSSQMLSDLRGSTVLVILASAHWDPAKEELAGMYAAGAGRQSNIRIVSNGRREIASLFGVRDATALFVVDGQGIIRWRYVNGVDPIPQSSIPIPSAPEPPPGPTGLITTRREFVQAALAAAVILAASLAPRNVQAAVSSLDALPSDRIEPRPVTLNVNGKAIVVNIEPRVTLLDALREYAGLTGSKKGCDHGQCGACTVHVDGRRVLSCMTFAVMQQGREITTIEGLAAGEKLNPMQQAFITHDGFQCGYCTSGQIMSAMGVLREPWGPADEDVREAMSGNICRCGAYPGIVAAVQSVRANNPRAGAE
jgi:xanthine dehydrogenase YagT iron-sulfur-binding subunit